MPIQSGFVARAPKARNGFAGKNVSSIQKRTADEDGSSAVPQVVDISASAIDRYWHSASPSDWAWLFFSVIFTLLILGVQ